MEENIAYGTVKPQAKAALILRRNDGISLNLGLYPEESGIALQFDSLDSLNGLILRLELLKKGMEAQQNEN